MSNFDHLYTWEFPDSEFLAERDPEALRAALDGVARLVEERGPANNVAPVRDLPECVDGRAVRESGFDGRTIEVGGQTLFRYWDDEAGARRRIDDALWGGEDPYRDYLGGTDIIEKPYPTKAPLGEYSLPPKILGFGTVGELDLSKFKIELRPDGESDQPARDEQLPQENGEQ